MLSVFISGRFNIISVFSHVRTVCTHLTLIVTWRGKGKILEFGELEPPRALLCDQAVGPASSWPRVLLFPQMPDALEPQRRPEVQERKTLLLVRADQSRDQTSLGPSVVKLSSMNTWVDTEPRECCMVLVSLGTNREINQGPSRA